jgi:lysophospholipase L1-like esterase
MLVCLLAIPMGSLPAEDVGKVVRIMPVGDSITEGGKTFSTYRYPLLKKLTDAGFKVEFVGSRQSDSPSGALRHEGYSGKNAEFLATIIGKSFRDHPADIVLLHSGHNHFIEEKPVDGIVAATESMIKTVREINPRVTVLVAEAITSGKLPKYSYIPALNEALRKMAARLDTPQQRVIAVNQADGFDWKTDTVDDKVHPNERGAEKMAARWFDALKPLLEKQP